MGSGDTVKDTVCDGVSAEMVKKTFKKGRIMVTTLEGRSEKCGLSGCDAPVWQDSRCYEDWCLERDDQAWDAEVASWSDDGWDYFEDEGL